MPHSYESKNNHADTHAIDSSNPAVRKTDEESRSTEENKTAEEERSAEGKRSLNFIERIIEQDLESGRRDTVITRFPPEPNGYLHMGHAKSICLNFGLAEKYQGTCHLRFDDTNPEKEEMEYIESIEKDVAWLGFDWGDRIYFASDYFEEIYSAALQLIKDGKAYVDSLSPEEIRAYRGTLKEPGKPSPDRERSIEENVKLFKEMKEGIHEDGKYILRAKIDMNSPNLNMRDPAIYRIKHASHPRTGSTWCIYPMYDFTHPLSDALEGITHSICTLEFEDHRPLYDWTVHETSLTEHEPQQIEFARLNLTYTIMSKRKLLQLVKENYVESWDDPRMPTISGIRRRGYTPAAIRDFSERIGVAKTNSTVEFALLEHCVREDLNKKAARAMAVLDPVRVIIQNYPENTEEWLEGINNPEDESMGTRQIPFSRELYIERDDFMIDPPKKYFRLAPGREVRLKHAYYITCVDYKTDDKGEVQEIICTYDPASRGGWTDDGRKVKGTSHWVSAAHAFETEVRMYSTLFSSENPGEKTGNFLDDINPESIQILKSCKLEPSLMEKKPGEHVQFLRKGYFTADTKDSRPGKPVFNLTVGLRDSWAKKMKKISK